MRCMIRNGKNRLQDNGFHKRPMKGYVMVDDTGMKTKKEFEYWINLCLEFNEKGESSKKKK